MSLGNITYVQFESVQDEFDFTLMITGGAPTKTKPSQQRYCTFYLLLIGVFLGRCGSLIVHTSIYV